MQYRVFDNKEKKWIISEVYLSPDGELYKIKQGIFGITKVPLALDSERYVYHRAINLYDKYKRQVCEGDYILAQVDKDKFVIGVVVFAKELSSYIILSDSRDEFFTLGSDVAEFIEIIGNVFDGYDGEESDDNKRNEAL